MQHIVLLDACFPLPLFLQSENVNVKLTNKHGVHYFDYPQDKLIFTLKTGVTEFNYSGTDFIVYKFTWSDATTGIQTMYVILFHGSGKDDTEKTKVGENLIATAYKWNLALKEEMWMFSDGHWSKDKKLWDSIQLASWDNLVLDPEFVVGLRRDTETFFSSQEIYESLGIPWKRGLLLLGMTQFSVHGPVALNDWL